MQHIRNAASNSIEVVKARFTLLAVAVMMMVVFATPAFAQAANPFEGATATVQQYMGYALAAGLIGLGTLAAIGLGKAIFRRLTS